MALIYAFVVGVFRSHVVKPSLHDQEYVWLQVHFCSSLVKTQRELFGKTTAGLLCHTNADKTRDVALSTD